MLDRPSVRNLLSRADLIGLARRKARSYDQESVRRSDVEDYKTKGWTVSRTGAQSAVMTRAKSHDVLLEDRVWNLLWQMQFPSMSGAGGAFVEVSEASESVTSQVDVMAADDDLCLAIECKSALARGRRPAFQQELAKHSAVRAPLARAINAQGGKASKRTVVLVLWTNNALLSANDRVRAREQNVVLLNEADLEYYETLVHHLGPAARYQFLAELIPGKAIPGLEIRVPALKSKMGAYECYTFSIAPDYLLKVAYVAHRSSRDSDIDTYQRMVVRSRLKKIAGYICSGPDAMFPTNIVINFEKPSTSRRPFVAFEKARQEEGAEGATFGWLTLRPAYKSAWIIDGQHRLYAYSYVGADVASRSRLSVLAFVGLPGRVQQKLFVDINAEQKSVKRNLLLELHPDIHRGDDDLKWRTKAIISKAIQELNDDVDSPLFDRIQLATTPKTDTRCITLTSLFAALEKPGFFTYSARGNQIVTPGPFWGPTDDKIIGRTTAVLNCWFAEVQAAVPDWWAAGAAEGGGLAMNDGVSIAVDVLRSVTEHLDQGRVKLAELSSPELTNRLRPWAVALAGYFAEMTDDHRRQFRQLRGNQGHATGLRHAQRSIQLAFPDFQPEGLAEFLEREKANTNDAAMARIVDIERQLCRVVIGGLRAQYGIEEDAWWYHGVPTRIRTAAALLQQEDRNRRGAQENYLDFIDYREVIHYNWPLLGDILAPGKQNQNKATRTHWMTSVNEIRKIAAHGSSAAWVSFEQLDELTDRLTWLKGLSVPAAVPGFRADLSQRDEG